MSFRIRTFALAFSIGLTSTVSAEVLTLQAAVEQSLAKHPRLAVEQYRSASAQANVKQAAVGTKPKLNLTIEDALGSGIYSSADAAQTTLSIAWVLEGSLLESRESAALSEQAVVSSEIKAKRLDVAAETASRFMQALLLQRRAELVTAMVKQAEQTLDQIQRRVDIGQAANVDALRAKAELAEAKLLQEDIEHEIRVAYRELATTMGAPEASFQQVSGNLSKLGTPVNFEQLARSLDSNPGLAVLNNRKRLAESQLALAKAEARSRWTFSTGLRHYALDDEVAMAAGVTLPLGGERRNRAAIESAALNVQASAAETEAQRLELTTQLYKLHEQWLHALHVNDSLQSEILPLLRQSLQETLRAYQRGQATYQTLNDIQSELLSAEGRLLDVQHRAQLNRIEIERLTGAPLDGSTP